MKLHYPLTVKHANLLLCWLVVIELTFALLFYLDYLGGVPSIKYHQLISLDLEANIPTWFSTIQLFTIGLIPLLLAATSQYKAPPSKRGIIIFGLGFIYLSLDETAVLHEKMTYTFHNNPLVPYFDGVHGIWITVYMVVLVLVLIILSKDLISIAKNFPKESWIFSGGMIVFLAGSGGAETVTFFYLDKSNLDIYNLEVIFEEFLEMLGASIVLYSVLRCAIKKSGQLEAPF